MDDTNIPKVSFIPKGSLVRDESFLTQNRPRSIVEFIAVFIFVASAGVYFGLYYYEVSLAKEVGTKTAEIKEAQKLFIEAPEVGKAKIFRTRADLARELLASHVVLAPALEFLSDNTLESIVYDRFSFLNNTGGHTAELSGEAPNYSALAYQADVFRAASRELSRFSIEDVTLTKFGTIKFKLKLTFAPDYLSYMKNRNTLEEQYTQKEQVSGINPVDFSGDNTADGNSSVVTTSATTSVMLVSTTTNAVNTEAMFATSTVLADGLSVTPSTNIEAPFIVPSAGTANAPETSTGWVTAETASLPLLVAPAEKPKSFLESLWSRIKFW